MSTDYCVIVTTFDDLEVGKKIINSLIENKLAACIQISDITSYFPWQGKVDEVKEKLVLIKTKKSLYEEVEKCILDKHSYEIPEVIVLPIEDGSVNYLDWIKKECK